jgi:hypothetical protein
MRCTRTLPFRLIALAVFAAMLAGVPAKLMAEPQAPTKEQSADSSLATSFVGKSYDDELDIDGWTDLGGGLVVAPIFVHEYQRDDGTFLVLTSRQISKETSTAPASFQVVDSLIVHPPQAGVEFSIACMQGQDETLRFMGEAKGAEEQEWWTDVRRAWEISLDTGKIAGAKTNGVRCTNVLWGQ